MAAATPALRPLFRNHVDLEWDRDGETDPRPLSGITFSGFPHAQPVRVEFNPSRGTKTGHTLTPSTPFAYRFAEPLLEPDRTVRRPQMATHGYLYHKTTCNSRPWEDGLCYAE
jgi:hypothetical protein